MPTILQNPDITITVTAGTAIGAGGQAGLTASTLNGRRGRFMIITDAVGLTSGRIATVNFGHPLSLPLGYNLQTNPTALIVGSFSDHDLTPTLLAIHPQTPPGLFIITIPAFSTTSEFQPMPQMIGFAVAVSGALTPSTTYVISWLVP